MSKFVDYYAVFGVALFASSIETIGCNSTQVPIEQIREQPTEQVTAQVDFFSTAHYNDVLKQAATNQRIEFCLARAIYEIEYQGVFYISSTGAVGIMELMPREGSYTTVNYENYQTARKTKERMHNGKSAEDWAALYVQDLDALVNPYINRRDYDGLFDRDPRFNPEWNIHEGVRELARAYHHFKAKGHTDTNATVFAIASYNAGIVAVEKGSDHIPQNDVTEYFVPAVVENLERCRE